MPENLNRSESQNQPEHLVLKENIIDGLDEAVERFQEGEISDLQLFAHAVNAWKEVNRNENLKLSLEEEMRKRRMALHQMAPLDISKGDPIKKRYNPNYWIGTKQMRENPQDFLLDRIASLKNLFESL